MIDKLYSIFQAHPLICTDTRNILPDSLFFALKGTNFNGNKFAQEALNAGSAYAIIDEPEFHVGDRTILVENVLVALQELATHHRKQLKIPVIGITGSNGKTTTKELMHAVLSQKYRCYATEGNFNNHIGVPLTLLKINSSVEIAIIEMGANHIGEIGFLCNISQPDYSIVTNIGAAHLEGFGSIEGVIKTKKALYDYVREHQGIAFVNRDNDLLMELAEGIEQQTFGTTSEATYQGKLVGDSFCLNVQWKTDTGFIDVPSNLVGDYNLENALAAMAIGSYFGVSSEAIKTAISSYVPANNRSQLIQSDTGATIVLDAYNANPTSMKAAIHNFTKKDSAASVLILGDMLELGQYSANEHQEIVTLAENLGFQNVLLVGTEFAKAKKPAHFHTAPDVAAAKTFLQNEKMPAKASILIKGSRGIRLESLVEIL